MRQLDRRIGIFQILLSGFCFGFLGVFGKWAFAAGLTPGEYLAWRFLLASSVLGIFLLGRNAKSLRLPPSLIFRGLALGVFGYATFSGFFFSALGGLSASLTVLLLYTYPVIVSLGAAFFFAERLHRNQWLALPLVIGGMLLLVWGEFSVRDPRYLIFGLLSALFYSGYILVSSRWLKGVAPLASSFYVMLGAGLAFGVLNLRPDRIPTAPGTWALLVATALISTLLAIAFFLAGLQKITSAEASILSAAEPVTGIAFAGILLGEALRPGQWLGGMLVLGGMLLVAAGPRANPPELPPVVPGP